MVVAQPGCDSEFNNTYLSAKLYFSVAIATVNRPALARLKRDFCTLATIGADRLKHLSRGTVTTVTVTVASVIAVCLSCVSAFRTTFRVVAITFGVEKLLVLNAESKGFATIGTYDRFVFETHCMTSSFLIS